MLFFLIHAGVQLHYVKEKGCSLLWLPERDALDVVVVVHVVWLDREWHSIFCTLDPKQPDTRPYKG